MGERPILFSAPMVRAILDGGKTQTRRVVKLVGPDVIEEFGPDGTPWPFCVTWAHGDDGEPWYACPWYGTVIGATQAVLVVAHITFLTNDGCVRMVDGSGVSVTTESMRRVARALGRVDIRPMDGRP